MDTASVVFIIAILILLAIMAIWAMTKRRREGMKKMQDEINLGDEIRTTSGICGVVVSFTKDKVTIESGDKGSEIVIERDAVSAVSKEKDTNTLKGA